MKRIGCILLGLVMVFGAVGTGTGEAAGTGIRREKLTLYVTDMEDTIRMPVYFINGVNDLPWADLESWAEVMTCIYRDFYGQTGFEMTFTGGETTARMTRENSPIENVVLDLSNNTGGEVNAAVFVTAWMLGEAPLSVKNNFTGALSNAVYRADVNLDREFDSRDTVEDKNLYCLISPVSFSCGNMVPAVLKASGRVSLLGRTSSGGSCTVQPLTTAWGAYFEISGPSQMSFLKNGAFYNIDQGVEPDFPLSRIRNFYDREALTEYINGLL